MQRTKNCKLPLLRARPINKSYQGHWMIIYIHSNPSFEPKTKLININQNLTKTQLIKIIGYWSLNIWGLNLNGLEAVDSRL